MQATISDFLMLSEEPAVLVRGGRVCQLNAGAAELLGRDCEGRSLKEVFGEEIEVKAWIVNLPGISDHADMDHLTGWITHFKSGKPLFVHFL